MNGVQIFSNSDFGEIRTVVIDSEPWFVGKDVAVALGYGKGKALNNAVANHVDEEDKGVTEMMTPGGEQKVVIINESGLYSLIFGSKLGSAKRFKKWVTSEVLPTIRKTGSYGNSLPQTTDEKIQLIAQGYTDLSKRVQSVSEEVEGVKSEFADFKQELPLFPVDMQKIVDAVKKKGIDVLGGKTSLAYKDRSIRSTVYRDIYQQIHRNFGVNSYKSLQRKDCDKAIGIVASYDLPYVLSDMITAANAQIVLDI